MMMLFFQRQRQFLLVLALFILAAWILVAVSEKGEYLLWVSESRTSWGDAVFPYITLLGEGWGFGLAGLLVLFFGRRFWLLGGGVVGGLAAAVAAMAKAYFLEPRPKLYFEQTVARPELVSHIEGVELATSATTSLPSGHTLAAAAIYLFLAFMLPSTRFSWAQIALLLLVVLVGFSRLYLFQHFLLDVVAGGSIGAGLALLGALGTVWACPRR